MIAVPLDHMIHGEYYYIKFNQPMREIGKQGTGKQIGVFDKKIDRPSSAMFSSITDINDTPSGLSDFDTMIRNPYHFTFYKANAPKIMKKMEIRASNQAVTDYINNGTNSETGSHVNGRNDWIGGSRKKKTTKRRRGRKRNTIRRRSSMRRRNKH
jgi:hypothetical protein